MEDQAVSEPSSKSGRRVAMIVGASGGLGAPLASAFRADGWIVEGTRFRDGGSEEWAALDVRDTDAVNAAVARVFEQHGRLDSLIYAAGVSHDALLARVDDAQWDETMAVNVDGAMRCSRAASRLMMRHGGGNILQIGSYVARAGRAGQSAYAASKAALVGLSQSLAREFGSRNVRVNVVLPGVMPTPMTAGLDADQLAELARENVLGRFNTIEEITAFIVFLAGTSNISGQVFQIDSRVARWS